MGKKYIGSNFSALRYFLCEDKVKCWDNYYVNQKIIKMLVLKKTHVSVLYLDCGDCYMKCFQFSKRVEFYTKMGEFYCRQIITQ